MGIDVSRLGQGAQRQLLQKMREQIEPKASKYKNVSTERNVGGHVIKFDSKKEAERFDYLFAMQKQGKIKDLKLQVEFQLTNAYKTLEGERIQGIKYVADFEYIEKRMVTVIDGFEPFEAWVRIVEDVKGKKTDVYEMKRKLMHSVHGITIQEV